MIDRQHGTRFNSLHTDGPRPKLFDHSLVKLEHTHIVMSTQHRQHEICHVHVLSDRLAYIIFCLHSFPCLGSVEVSTALHIDRYYLFFIGGRSSINFEIVKKQSVSSMHCFSKSQLFYDKKDLCMHPFYELLWQKCRAYCNIHMILQLPPLVESVPNIILGGF